MNGSIDTLGEIYLDHAATSFPKAPGVAQAVREWFDELGVSAARGSGRSQRLVADRVFGVRRSVAEMCGVLPDRVAFCSGATEALNMAFGALLQPGDRVVTTRLEHSSVVRPLCDLRNRGALELAVVEPRRSPGGTLDAIDIGDVAAALAAAPTKLLVFTSASNVTGRALDGAALSKLAHEHGALVLCDASQTAGALGIDFGADLIAASAHKSLLGPPGLGFLAAREGLLLRPTKLGGTGSSTALDRHPIDWPAAFEAGTPNTPAILGLGAALEWRSTQDPCAALAASRRACEALIRTLRTTDIHGDPDRVTIHGSPTPDLPIVSFTVRGYDSAEIGMILDDAGIVVRTGFHCAPWIHACLETEASGGTVRVSPGPFVTEADVLQVSAALASS